MEDEQLEMVFFAECGDCGRTHYPIHHDAFTQRGEPICTHCAARGAFDP